MIRKTLLITAFSLVALLIQILFGPWLTIREIRPDFLLILVLYVGRTRGKIGGQVFGFTIGLIADMIGLGSFVGLSALTKTIAGFGAGLLKNRNHRLNPVLFYGFEVLLIGLHYTIFYMVNFKGIEISSQLLFLHYILPSILYTGLFYFVIQYFLPPESE